MSLIKTTLSRQASARIRDGGKDRPIVIEISPDGVAVRQHGRRRRFTLDFVSLYEYAAKCEADRRRAEKRRGKR